MKLLGLLRIRVGCYASSVDRDVRSKIAGYWTRGTSGNIEG